MKPNLATADVLNIFLCKLHSVGERKEEDKPFSASIIWWRGQPPCSALFTTFILVAIWEIKTKLGHHMCCICKID
jgi:hypothetical protein